MAPDQRKPAYDCDITYGTNNEFGFDYLRDNMSWSLEETVQRGHHFAIVDEVDSILIDEARTPLIISGPADQPTRWYMEFARIAPMLKRDDDYEVDESKRTVAITEAGVEKVEDQLGIDNLYESVNTPLVGYLNNALKAKELYKKDKDYIVVDGEVLIVDEFTGRVLHGRRYSEGMHQAIEAKENVEIKQENQTLATITLQNYFRLYDKLAGMTGTAMTEAAEFSQIYKLGVVPIPTNMPMIREDVCRRRLQDRGREVRRRRRGPRRALREGQPVLVGTTSVQKSEYLHGPAGQARRPARGAQRQAARAGGDDRRAGRPQGRDHGRDQHGRPRHRHHARRQPGVPGRPGAQTARPQPVGEPRGLRGGLARRAGQAAQESRPRSTRRSSSSAACTCWGPSATSPAASTTSCAAGRAGRATRASRASTCRWATTSCGCSTRRRSSRS